MEASCIFCSILLHFKITELDLPLLAECILIAKVYRNEHNISDLYTTLSRYCSLSEVIPQHQNYSTYLLKEKLHHNKIYQEFVKELKVLKPTVGNDLQSQKNYALSNLSERKVKYCAKAETKSQSFSSVNEENIGLASVTMVDSSTSYSPVDSFCSTSSMTAKDCWGINVHFVTQSSPSPVRSFIHNVPNAAHVSHITAADSRHGHSNSSFSESSGSKDLQDVHISARLMEDFLELARDNTNKDLETCGILGAFLKKGTFYVTTLIVPKQESTSNFCQAIKEEEIFAIQEEQSLVPVGWIHQQLRVLNEVHLSVKNESSLASREVLLDLQPQFISSPITGMTLHPASSKQADGASSVAETSEGTTDGADPEQMASGSPYTHPSQSCFMSSIDLHTHYAYQVMIPEAVAIVMAPTDISRSYGIFRISDPGGTTVLKECQESGFHLHQELADRSPIYEHCSNVYINPNLRFEIFDLR
ncbi:hypothetical protein HHK36_029625 [Tetracentron sinense]|uniref:MPN domain-containing protein n=1 Tax=Tetracentron sinense TaxID=13715 RepID=A0A834YEA6_TETSI|nr:hypothetical protein HHK36_029625 [Tetracentron sinense]